MNRTWPSFWVCLCWLGAAACARDAEPILTSDGPVQGVVDGDVIVYKGVPFAAPPVGDMRWRAPQPVTPWRKVRRATEFVPMCVQVGPAVPGLPQEPINEDCLYLNVWTPASAAPGELPVIVWFHGGGFRNGSASTSIYSGRELARKGVVVVNVAYRLGRIGFLAHPDLTRESGRAASGNYAVLDAIAALQWVKRNIAAFGGDPARVTLMGHSAGSFMAGNLVISPLAKGLFHRVIGLTGISMAPAGTPSGIQFLRDAEKSGEAVVREFGAQSISELRKVRAEDLVANDLFSRDRTVIDGFVFTADAHSRLTAGAQHDVPLILGYTTNEGGNMLRQPLSAEHYIAQTRADNGPLAERILALYPAGSDEQATRSQQLWIRDNQYGWHMWTWARLQANTGKSNVYFYNFDHSPPYPRDTPMASWGAAHGTELLYVFGNLDQFPLPWTASDRALTSAITGYLVNFARTGDPNGDGLPAWPAFASDDETVLSLGSTIETVGVLNRAGLEVQNAYMSALREASARGEASMPD